MRSNENSSSKCQVPSSGMDTEHLSLEDTREMTPKLPQPQIDLSLQHWELQPSNVAPEEVRERYFDLYNQAPVGYCAIRETELIQEANLTLANLLGVPQDTLDRQPITSFILPEDRKLYSQFHKRLRQSGTSQILELRMLKGKCEVFWALLVASVVRDSVGSSTIRIALSDVTKCREMEKQCEDTTRARSMIRSAFDAMWLVDSNGMILDANTATFRMHGFSLEELLGMRVCDLETRESKQQIRSRIRKVIQHGSDHFHSIHRRKDGSEFPVEVSVATLPGQNLMVATIRDETEALEAQDIAEAYQKHLELQNQEISDLYNLAPCGYHSLDANGTFIAINDTELTMLGYARDEVIGFLNIRDLIPSESMTVFTESFSECISVGSTKNLELDLIRKDGSVIPVLISSMAMRNDVGAFLHVRATVVDNTDRILTRKYEAKARKELERLVLKRTAQVRLLAAEAVMAEERERHAIASDLHDDLGQILLVVKLKLEAMARATPQCGCSPLLADLGRLIGDANRTVRSLTSQLSPPALDTLGLFPALANLAEEMATTFGLDVQLEDDGHPKPLALPHAAILFRAVRELLLNVVKHAGVKEARVGVYTANDHLVLTVADTGRGLGNLDWRLPTNRGFGLRSMRERILQLGGEMNLKSLQGGGTTATLRMPLTRNSRPAAKASS